MPPGMLGVCIVCRAFLSLTVVSYLSPPLLSLCLQLSRDCGSASSSLSSTWGEERPGKLLGILRTPSSDPDLLVSTSTLATFVIYCAFFVKVLQLDLKRACLDCPNTFVLFLNSHHKKKKRCLLMPGAEKKLFFLHPMAAKFALGN